MLICGAVFGFLCLAQIAQAVEKNFVTVLATNPTNEKIIRGWFSTEPELNQILSKSVWIVMTKDQARFASYYEQTQKALRKRFLTPAIIVQRPDGQIVTCKIDGRTVSAVFAGTECRLDLLKEYLPDLSLGMRAQEKLPGADTTLTELSEIQRGGDNIGGLFRHRYTTEADDIARPFRHPKPCPSPNDTPEPDPEPSNEPVIQQPPTIAPVPVEAKHDNSLMAVLVIGAIAIVGLLTGIGTSFFREVRG
jgi:hypothetical protein